MSKSQDSSTASSDSRTTRDNAWTVIIVGILVVGYAVKTIPLLSTAILGPLAFGGTFIATGIWCLKAKK